MLLDGGLNGTGFQELRKRSLMVILAFMSCLLNITDCMDLDDPTLPLEEVQEENEDLRRTRAQGQSAGVSSGI